MTRPIHRPFVLAVLLLLAALPAVSPPAAAAERALSWRSVALQARLDRDGLLHVTETQEMVFTGDWNGGERRFPVDLGEALVLRRLSRVEPGGREVPLVEGDLDEVDRYDWAEKRTLRWRSRLPSDPPFDHTPLTYRLEYEMRGVVHPMGDGKYRLAHNFLFPDRPGPVDRFSLDLALDPAWRSEEIFPAHMEEHDIAPGAGFRFPLLLFHRGPQPPAAVPIPPPGNLAGNLWAAVLLAVLPALLACLLWRERRRGRFAALPVPPEGDTRFLERELFSLRPEEVGALWDRRIGPPEVAAILARLTAEGKLESRVTPGKKGKGSLALALKQPLASFAAGYERDLLAALFFDGRTEVDTADLRAHYKTSGFDPAKLVRRDLQARLAAEMPAPDAAPRPWPEILLAAAAIAAFALEIARYGAPALPAAVAALVGTLVLYPLAAWGAYRWRDRIDHLLPASLSFLLPSLIALAGALVLAFPSAGSPLLAGFWTAIALPLATVAFFWSIAHWAMSREKPEAIALRKKLAAARELFRRELESPKPRLQDAWFPYLLAFGLAQEADRWSAAFGANTTTIHVPTPTAGGSGSGAGWTGGGGSFGGAGATAGWAAAATGLAGGVASAGSSSSAGGGSFSGGGGGGGW
jgi:hypothetical protein